MKFNTANLIDVLFGCWHRNLSFPQSVRRGQRRPSAAWPTGMYVVCLDCGKEFAYNWQEMRVVEPGERPDPQHAYRSRAA